MITTRTQETLSGIDALEKMAEWGLGFVLLNKRTKVAFEEGWQQKPRNLKDAIAHANKGNNIGVLLGENGAYHGMLDIDKPPITYPDFCERFPNLAKTPTIFRRNAPHKAKLLFKIKTNARSVMPPGTKFRQPNPQSGKLETVIEWLSTGNQGVVPPSINIADNQPAQVELKNFDIAPIELTVTELSDIWYELTGKNFLGDNDATPPAAQAKTPPGDINPFKLISQYQDFVNSNFPPQTAKKLSGLAADVLIVESETDNLNTLTIDEVMTTDWPEPIWAIPALLPVGLTILAGKPKLGKSWLLLQLAKAVAGGDKVFNNHIIEAGPVLYLALEDNARRLQDRIKMQGWDWRGLPIEFVTMSEFKNQMGSFLDSGAQSLARKIELKRYHLVMVDTLSRACFNDPNRNELMSATLAPLQELAMMNNTALLFVDHHNKSAGALMDAIGDILGGTSKGATLDTAWGLYRERGKQEANLAITGRDVEEQNLSLTFDKTTGLWDYNGDYYALKITEARQEVLSVLEDLEGSAQATEVAQNLGITRQATRQQLEDLVNAGYITKVKKGRFVFYETLEN